MAWQGHPENSGVRSIIRTGAFARAESSALSPRAEWPDEVLMVAITARDEYAFSVMYDRYIDLVFSTSLRVLADAQLAEDTAQDVFVRLWRRPETFISERGRFLSWLMSVTRNRAVDELRARGRRRRREGICGADTEDALAAVPADDCDDPIRWAQLHEEQRFVRNALKQLPREQQAALELAYFGGLTQQEIAGELHEPLGTIKTRIRLGMQKLRCALADQV
jgi:RNA polymerase sigma-70 factor, ECF subfamily